MKVTRALPLLLALSSCLTDAGLETDAGPTAAPPSGPPPVAGWPVAPWDAAETPQPDTATAPQTKTRIMVLQTLGFTRESTPGVAPGFDLDGQTTAKGDPESCGHGDLVAPDGQPGIDNQLAVLVPLFDLVGLGAVESLVQGAIEDGGLILLWQLDGVDDLANDDDVTVTMRIGQGVPLLGTDGLVLAGQTFAPDTDAPQYVANGARIEAGVLSAGPFDTKLPIVVFGVRYELRVRGARLRATVSWDGDLQDGLIGGAVPLEDLLAIATTADNADDGILATVKPLLDVSGDLGKGTDGACTEMSSALTFSAVSAFVNE
jgi:hypothetical protein